MTQEYCARIIYTQLDFFWPAIMVNVYNLCESYGALVGRSRIQAIQFCATAFSGFSLDGHLAAIQAHQVDCSPMMMVDVTCLAERVFCSGLTRSTATAAWH